jgi:hypothetical protein
MLKSENKTNTLFSYLFALPHVMLNHLYDIFLTYLDYD